MEQSLTPKQVARAMDVSESSIKRWCDNGAIATVRTAGGHRRILLSGVLEFLSKTDRQLARPELLSLPATSGRGPGVVARARERLIEALLAGDEERCRSIVFDLFLAGHRISAIGDKVLAESFREIGNRWECGEAEVYQERRGCEIVLRILHELGRTLPAPAANAPLAIGGAVEGDVYQLSTALVELVLRQCGWRAVSLGSNLPFTTLSAAIDAHRPRLFWISVSHVADEERFVGDYAEFFSARGAQTPIVVGGRALAEPLRLRINFAAHCDNLEQLESLSTALRSSPQIEPQS